MTSLDRNNSRAFWLKAFYSLMFAVVISIVFTNITYASDFEQETSWNGNNDSSQKQPAGKSVTAELEAEYWQSRVNKLLVDIESGIRTPANADTLYAELSKRLRVKRRALRLALRWVKSPNDKIGSSAPSDDDGNAIPQKWVQPETVGDVYSDMVSLYQTRILLLQAVTTELYTLTTGHGEAGQARLKGELDYILLYLRFHSMAVPQLVPHLLDKLTVAPVPVIWELTILILAILLFRWWRHWAPMGLVSLRGRILQIKPRTLYSVRFARLVWYFQEIRSPLEWMLLATVLLKAIDVPSLLVIEDFMRIVLRGILFTWVAVRLINAIASRGVAGLSDDTSDLRLRSLKLIAGWILILNLGLKITETYAGQGTTYEMVWTLFQVLSIPGVILLLSWWRLEVRQNLEELPGLPDWIANTTKKRWGPRAYLDTLKGCIYLIFVVLRQFGIRQFSKFESGREILVRLMGRELFREQEKKAQEIEAVSISDELVEKLLNADGQLASKVHNREFNSLIETVEFGHGGTLAITGERGLGKSQLLARLSDRFEGKSVVIKCNVHGFEDIKQSLAEKFSVPKDQLDPDRFIELVEEHDIRVIAFDNMHHLTTPKADGLIELVRLAEFIAPLRSRSKICLIFTIVKPAYQYLSGMRSEQALLDDFIELPTWTLEQITQLIEIRSRQAGIEPDFSEIDIPHQYDDVDYDTLEERTRSGFYRILWNVSAGNPAVALRLWIESLAVTEDGRFIVQVLPHVFGGDQLENANLSVLLMLRVLIQTGQANAEDIGESLRFKKPVVENGIRFALLHGWIEEVEDHYQITWRWFRTINRVLARQNLLTR